MVTDIAGVTASELHSIIRGIVNEWGDVYQANVGHRIEVPYLASLANDISFELGILEASRRETPAPLSHTSPQGSKP